MGPADIQEVRDARTLKSDSSPHLFFPRLAQAKRVAPHSLRALYGTDSTRFAVTGSLNKLQALRDLSFWFGGDDGLAQVQCRAPYIAANRHDTFLHEPRSLTRNVPWLS